MVKKCSELNSEHFWSYTHASQTLLCGLRNFTYGQTLGNPYIGIRGYGLSLRRVQSQKN